MLCLPNAAGVPSHRWLTRISVAEPMSMEA